MLSPSITQMLDRVRSEFGIQADVLDVNLASTLSPERRDAMGVHGRPDVHAAALGAVRENRSADVQSEGRSFRLIPLRRNRSAAAVLVVEAPADAPPDGVSGRALDAFIELLRSAIEADLAARDDVHGERQQNRTLLGILRFLRYVLVARTEQEVADAVMHAAAVWFDADARVYRLEPNGDYVLYASLPAAEIAPGSERFHGLAFATDLGVVRLASVAGLRGLGANREGVLVPAWGAQSVEWVLALFGHIPPDAELTLSIVGRVIGAQMERLALRPEAELRGRFEDIVSRVDRATELTAVEAMRQLIATTRGAAAALWIHSGGGVRRIALVGSGIHDPGETWGDEQLSGPARHVRTLALGNGSSARIELIAGPDAPFGSSASAVIDSCARVLRVWLAGAAVPEHEGAFDADRPGGFARRIEEELARARRFDRRFAVLLVQASRPGAGRGDLQELMQAMRLELRQSDLLGVIGHDRVVALLVETDASGVGPAIQRVRARLGEVAAGKGLTNIAVGEAAFSDECSTVDDLLARAALNAQVISDAV